MINMPKKRFYMTRHGEAAANAEGCVAGTIDSPLTTKGRAEARRLCPYLKALPISPQLIVHTSLSRSKETAFILNEALNALTLECALLSERYFGDWQGLPLEIMRKNRDEGQEPPNGETMQSFVERVAKGMEEVLSLSQEPILIVAHAGVFEALMRNYGCKIEVPKNCQLYEFVPHTEEAIFPWKLLKHVVSNGKKPSQILVGIEELSSNHINDTPFLPYAVQKTSLSL